MNLKRSKGRILPAICIIVALSFEGISASTSTPNHDPSKEDFATSTRNWSETSRQLEAQKDDKVCPIHDDAMLQKMILRGLL